MTSYNPNFRIFSPNNLSGHSLFKIQFLDKEIFFSVCIQYMFCLSVCISFTFVCLSSICLCTVPVYMSICLTFYLCVCNSSDLFVCLCFTLYLCVYKCLFFIHLCLSTFFPKCHLTGLLFFCLSVILLACLSAYSSVKTFTYADPTPTPTPCL